MFSKFLLTAALSILAFTAAADEVPASSVVTAEAPSDAASAPTAASAPAASPVAATPQSSVLGGFGRMLGSFAKSATNVAKTFTDGVKQGYVSVDATVGTAQSRPAAQPASTASAAPAASDEGKTDLASRIRDLRSKLLLAGIGREVPAPVETRVATPVVTTEPVQQ